MKQANNRNLGPLENEVMQVIWEQGQTGVGKVHEAMSKKKEIAYTTVMTIMSRLAEKGLLARKRNGRAYIYSPSMTEKQTIRQLIRANMEKLMDQFGQEAVVAFTDELESIKNDTNK